MRARPHSFSPAVCDNEPEQAARARGGRLLRVNTYPLLGFFESRQVRWAALSVSLALAIMTASSFAYLPTEIEAELLVNGFSGRVAGASRQALTDREVSFSALALTRFSQLELDGLVVDGGAEPKSVQPTTLVARDSASQVRFQRTGAASLGTLDRIWVEPGTLVQMELDSGGETAGLRLDIGPTNPWQIFLAQPFEMMVDFAAVEPAMPGESPHHVRGRLDESNPFVRVSGGADGLALVASIETPAAGQVLLSRELALSELSFTSLDVDGALRTNLAGPGTIRYSAQHSAGPDHDIEITAEDFLIIDRARNARFRQIDVTPEGFRLSLAAELLAGRVGSVLGSRELRQTAYERWLAGHLLESAVTWLGLWAAVAVWLSGQFRKTRDSVGGR